MHKKTFFIGIIGNLLEQYDAALFGCLAPFIAPLFFHNQDPITALFLTYSLIPLGMLTRPLGALCIGWIGDRFGRRQALLVSLSGMGLVTMSLGFLPTAQEIGVLAPILLAIFRLMQSFFAAGEITSGAIYILEKTDAQKRSFTSSLIDASTIGGVLIASCLVTFFSVYQWVEVAWRTLFWAGGLTALVGLFLRLKTEELPSCRYPLNTKADLFRDFKTYKGAFFAIVLAAGFSYTTYALAFSFMNGYVPLVTSFSKSDMMKVNTALLVFDLGLLPLFGLLARKIGKEKIMFFGAFAFCLVAIPLLTALGPASTLAQIAAIRFAIVLFGVAFAAPYHAWALSQVPPHCRSTILCFGYTLGSQVIGTPTAPLCIWLYKQTGWVGAPALYLLPITIGAFVALRLSKRGEKPAETSYPIGSL